VFNTFGEVKTLTPTPLPSLKNAPGEGSSPNERHCHIRRALTGNKHLVLLPGVATVAFGELPSPGAFFSEGRGVGVRVLTHIIF